MIPVPKLLAAAATALLAGAINAMSGGGTLLTFPVLIGLGIPAISANATSTVALWPGVIGSIWGYRQDLRGAGRWRNLILAPSILGGVLGAFLLVGTKPAIFGRIAPFLVLGATLLFMSSSLISSRIRARAAAAESDGNTAQYASEPGDVPADRGDPSPAGRKIAAYLFFQLVVAIYGGYFGAGIGILMLAALGIMEFRDIHRMNGLKAWGAFCINGVAVLIFVTRGLVDWSVGLSMAAGGLLGGYLGARIARRVGQRAVRAVIILVGFSATVSLLISRPH